MSKTQSGSIDFCIMKHILRNSIAMATVWLSLISSAEEPAWLSAKRWRGMGSAPVRILETRENTLTFSAEFENRKKALIYPMFHLYPGETFAGAAMLEIELRITPVSSGKLSGALILPKQPGMANYLPLKLANTAERQKVQVTFPREYDLSKPRILQIQIQTEEDSLRCEIYEIRLLNADGEELGLKRRAQPAFFLSGADQYLLTENQPALLALQCGGTHCKGKIHWRLLDFSGTPDGAEGTAEVKAGTLLLNLPPRQGFRELELSPSGQRIGLLWLPPATVPEDHFWGVNSILAVKHLHARSVPYFGMFDSANRIESFFRLLKRCGIHRVREMAAYFFRAPRPGDPFRETLSAEICRRAERNDIQILTFYAHFPAYLGTNRGTRKPGEQPRLQVTQLKALYAPLAEMLHTEEASAAGIQMLNECDNFAQASPPDGTASLTSFVRNLLEREKIHTPLIGMAFMNNGSYMMERYARNDFFSMVQAMAIHDYRSPEEFSDGVIRTVSWLSKRAEGGIFPDLWITECGLPWRRGSFRASLNDDLRSASTIARKAVFARAAGLGAFFVFCLPYYDENSNNFGLLDYAGSPHRAFAAYVAAIRFLSGKSYLGDVKSPLPAGCRSIRLFSSAAGIVAVIETERNRFVPGELPLRNFRAADGSPLAIAGDGSLPAVGGVVYAEFSGGMQQIDSRTSLAQCAAAMKMRKPVQPAEHPLVFRHHFERFRRSSLGYYPEKPVFPVSVSVLNMSRILRRVEPIVTDCLGQKISISPAVLEVPPGAEMEFHCTLDIGRRNRYSITITENSGQATKLFLEFFQEGAPRPIPGAAAAGNWRASSSGRMRIEDVPGENAVRFTVDYPDETDTWAFPEYDLAPGESPAGAVGIAYDIRTETQDEKVGYTNTGCFFLSSEAPYKYSVIKPEGVSTQWTTRRIWLPERPETIRSIIPGVNPRRIKRSTFYIRNLRFF